MHAYDVLGSPVRRRIVELLLDGGRTPGAISDVIRREFGISQPAVSHHLRILRDSGFTVAQAVGTCRLYTVNVEPLREVDRWLERFRRFWGQRLDVLTTELAQTTEPVRITDRTATASHENTNNAVDHDSQLGTRRTGWTMTDILDAFNAAQREISRSRIQSGDAWRVTLRRTYHAPIEDVWDAITNPDRLRRWFLPVTVEPRRGGKFQLEGNAGGEIIGCEPPRLLRVTWAFGENITEKDINEVEVRLSAAPDGGTLFELSHSAPPNEHWDRFGPGATGVGWDIALISLGLHLRGEVIEDPQAWEASPEVRELMLRSATAWGTAHEAAGVPSEEATRAAQNTAAFYVPDSAQSPASDA